MTREGENKMRKKEYNIGDERFRRPLYMPINERMVIQCRPIVQKYKKTPLHKQFFKLMEWCKENDIVLPKGTAIAILRKALDTRPIKREELDHFNVVVYDFRKWLGTLAGMVVYQFRARLKKNSPVEVVYRPLKDKAEYMAIAGRHIENVRDGADNRHESNLNLFKMTQKQIDGLIDEVSTQIDMEAELPPDTHKKGRRKK